MRRRHQSTQRMGEQSEQMACTFFQRQGFMLIAKNHHCRFGEIDLVMQDGQTLVFIEVRERNSDKFGSAIDSITARKQKKIIATAQHFLAQHPKHQLQPCRFDVVGIHPSQPDPDQRIQWLKNAFSAY